GDDLLNSGRQRALRKHFLTKSLKGRLSIRRQFPALMCKLARVRRIYGVRHYASSFGVHVPLSNRLTASYVGGGVTAVPGKSTCDGTIVTNAWIAMICQS